MSLEFIIFNTVILISVYSFHCEWIYQEISFNIQSCTGDLIIFSNVYYNTLMIHPGSFEIIKIKLK